MRRRNHWCESESTAISSHACQNDIEEQSQTISKRRFDMTMHVKLFKQNMLVYGSDVYKWPESIREAELKALDRSSEIQELLADEECFERAPIVRAVHIHLWFLSGSDRYEELG